MNRYVAESFACVVEVIWRFDTVHGLSQGKYPVKNDVCIAVVKDRDLPVRGMGHQPAVGNIRPVVVVLAAAADQEDRTLAQQHLRKAGAHQ